MLTSAPLTRTGLRPCFRKSQQGVMLLEALISIAIFSIGVLGLIGLQSAAIKSSNDARQRAVAAFYANQIIGQMWADAGNLAAYQHKPKGMPASSACEFSGTASTNEKVTAWITTIQGDLNVPAGSSMQQIAIGASNLVTVTLCWKNPEEAVYHWFTTAAQIQMQG